MSEQSNTNLFERASEVIDYFENELPARVIQRDIDANDLEALAVHVKEAEAMIAVQEDNFDLVVL